jgi:hypothetical protein
MKLRIGLMILTVVASLPAQQPTQTLLDNTREAIANGKAVTKVVTLQYPQSVDTHILDDIGLIVKRSGAVMVITGVPERVDTAEAILKQLDVAPPPRPAFVPQERKGVQLTAYLIVASRNGTQEAVLPRDLESAAGQVASALSYKSFSLLDSIDMRLTSGTGGELKGILPQGQSRGGEYALDVGRINLVDNSDLIRIEKFNLYVHVQTGESATLQTDVDMKAGQKVVVGKANIDTSADALIVILTAKPVD